MTTKDLIKKAGLKSLSTFEHRDIEGVFISDMVSDVMANAKSGNVWLTVQTHKSIVPAANLIDIAAIIITSGKKVPQDTIDLASKFGIAILLADLSTFELAGKLHELIK